MRFRFGHGSDTAEVWRLLKGPLLSLHGLEHLASRLVKKST